MPYQQFRRREGNSRGRGRGGRGRPFSRRDTPYERARSDSRHPGSGSGNQENGTIIQLLQQLTGAVRELQRQPSSERRAPSGGRGGRRGSQHRPLQSTRPPAHRRPSPAPPSDGFQSNNPDFRSLVKHINQGARISRALQNWESLPSTIDRAVDRVTDSIKPPLVDQALSYKLHREADKYKSGVRHLVQEHLKAKFNSTSRQMGQLDQQDAAQAMTVAKRQLLRSNTRINAGMADDLIHASAGEMWQLARTGTRSRTPPQPMEVPTSNRFQVLGEELAADQIVELLNQSSPQDESDQVPPPLPQRKKRDYTTPVDNVGKRLRVQVHASDDSEFRIPDNPTRTPANPAHPREGLNLTSGPASAATPASDDRPPSTSTPLPSPVGSTGPDRAERMRLAVFHPKAKDTWTIPEIQDSETTILLADSNGPSLARFSPPSWRVAAYRGGTIEDINKLLASSPLPDHVKNVIIAVGLNDRVSDDQTLVNRVSRLRELVNVSTRTVRVLEPVSFTTNPTRVAEGHQRVVGYFRDLFDEDGTLVKTDAIRAASISKEDFSHFTNETAQQLVSLLTLAGLN